MDNTTYIVDKKIGEGSFGTVYKGRNRSRGNVVAIKELKKLDLTEIQILKQADHKNIVKLIEFLPEKGWIILEFCEFGSLDGYLKKQQPDKKQRMKLLTDMSAGLAYLHEIGIIHRDLKPANILVDKDRVAKIADFGLAKDVGDFATSNDVSIYISTLAGSMAYMAPEVFNRRYKLEADVFSLGLVFGATLSERFKREIESQESIGKKMYTDPKFEYSVPSYFDDPMQRLIANMVKRNYNARPKASDVHKKILKF